MKKPIIQTMGMLVAAASCVYAGPDGIDIVNSTNVKLTNVFACGEDDAVCVKALAAEYGGDRTSPRHNYFSDILVFNDGYRAFKIGTETEADEFTDIIFENCYAVKSGMTNSVYLTDDALVHNVNYRNIYSEQSSKFGVSCSPFSGRNPSGDIRDVFIRNLWQPGNETGVRGYSSSSTASSVHFTNVFSGGNLVTEPSAISTNQYTSNVTLSSNPVIIDDMIFPYHGQVVRPGESFNLQVAAHHLNGNGLTVTFYADGQAIGTSSSAPYELSWTPTDDEYAITASAHDNSGNRDSILVSRRLLVRGDLRADSIAVYPADIYVGPDLTHQFQATVFDQYGDPLHPQPADLRWSVNGGGTIEPTSGLFTAGGTNSGPHSVSASLSTASLSATAKVQVSDSLIIDNLTVATGKSYEWATLKNGSLRYIDRDATFNPPPELLGNTYLRTANNDKNATNNPLITFTVSLPTTVYLQTYNDFNTSQEWFSGFVATDRSGVYKKTFDAGRIKLGPNGTSNMYVVMLDAGGDVVTRSKTAPLRELSAPVLTIHNNEIAIRNARAGDVLSIFTVSGRLVLSHTVKNESARINLSSPVFVRGYYLTRIKTETGTFSQSLLVR